MYDKQLFDFITPFLLCLQLIRRKIIVEINLGTVIKKYLENLFKKNQNLTCNLDIFHVSTAVIAVEFKFEHVNEKETASN